VCMRVYVRVGVSVSLPQSLARFLSLSLSLSLSNTCVRSFSLPLSRTRKAIIYSSSADYLSMCVYACNVCAGQRFTNRLRVPDLPVFEWQQHWQLRHPTTCRSSIYQEFIPCDMMSCHTQFFLYMCTLDTYFNTCARTPKAKTLRITER